MIPLFIPFKNRPDLLERAMASVPRVDGIQVTVINNSDAEHVHVPMGTCMTPRKGMTFSETQNLMMKTAKFMNAPFYFFMHSDAEAAPGTVLRLFEMARLEQRNWGAIFTNYDALAAFKTRAFDDIGGWDEEFAWYASDQDCYRRLTLAGYELLESNLPVYHEPSQTLKADPSIAATVADGFQDRTKRYREKWGGEAGRETFTTPWGI